jgi:hypothetical protein
MNKKINELESKLRAVIKEMDTLNQNVQMTDEQVKEWDAKKNEVSAIEAELKRAQDQEEINKKLAGMALRNEEDGEKKDIAKSFYRAVNEYVNTNGRSISKEFMGNEGGLFIPKEILRADPILSTTNTSLVNVGIENSLSVVTGDDFTLLQSLGVQFLPGLTGKHELPYMAQLSTSKPAENTDASTASATPLNVELAPQAYSSFQTWSKQALLTMPSAIYTGIIGDMQKANERQVVADLFNEVFLTDVSIAATAAGLTYGDMIRLTNIDYNIGNASFVTDNNIRVYLEQKPVNSSGIALAWNALNNTVGGRRAIASSAMKSKRAVYGNFGFAAVGEWGTPELIVNPYTYDSTGKLKVTVLGFYDGVIRNKYAFKYFSADASCGI